MNEQRDAVRVMQDYISEHLMEEITIEDLADAVNFSPSYARRIFEANLNMTPRRFISGA